MQLAGSPSWRFSEDSSDTLQVALYIRDVGALDVPVVRDVPPALDGVPPGASVGPEAAVGQWLDWWHALLAVWLAAEQRASDPSGPDARSQVRDLMAARLAVYDPPEFGSLVGSPELRELLRSGFADANRWVRRPPNDHPAHFDYEIIRGVAEDVARAHGVSPGAVRASAQVLPVRGVWWHLVRPGAVLCSDSAARDDDSARVLLREAFESALRG